MKKQLIINNSKISIILLTFFSLTIALNCAAKKKIFTLAPRDLQITAKQPPADRDIHAITPGEYQLAAQFDFKKINSSPLKPILQTLAQTLITGDLPQKEIINLLKKSTEVLFVSGHTVDKTEEFAAVIKTTTDINKLINRLINKHHAKEISINNKNVIKLGAITLFAATKKTLVLGTEKAVTQSIELINGKGKSLKQQAKFKTLKIKKNAAILKFIATDNLKNKTITDALKGTPFRWVSKIKKSDAKANLEKGLAVELKLVMPNEKQAKKATIQMRNQWRTLLSNPFLKLLNIKWLKKKLVVKNSKKNIKIKISLSKGEIHKLNGIIAPLMQIQKLMNGMLSN